MLADLLLLPGGGQLELDKVVVEKDVATLMVHSLQMTGLYSRFGFLLNEPRLPCGGLLKDTQPNLTCLYLRDIILVKLEGVPLAGARAFRR